MEAAFWKQVVPRSGASLEMIGASLETSVVPGSGSTSLEMTGVWLEASGGVRLS